MQDSYLSEENARRLAHYITQVHGEGKKIEDCINPYGSIWDRGYEVLKDVVVNATLEFNAQNTQVFLKDAKFDRDFGAHKLDLSHVCFYGMNVRRIWWNAQADTPAPPFVVGLNFEHKGNQEHMKVWNETVKRMLPTTQQQQIHSECLFYDVTPSGPCGEVVPEESRSSPFGLDIPQYGTIKRFFSATFGMVDKDEDLLAGCIKLPPQVCQQLGLPVYAVPPNPPEGYELAAGTWNEDAYDTWLRKVHNLPADKPLNKVRFFAAIPVDHALAWPLNSDGYAQQRGLRSEKLWVTNPNNDDDVVLWYHIVTDRTLFGLRDSLMRDLVPKVDRRPLQDVAFEIILKNPNAPIPQDLRIGMTVTLKYLAPSLDKKKPVAIAMHPEFPSASNWAPTATAQMEEQIRKLFMPQGEGQGFKPPPVKTLEQVVAEEEEGNQMDMSN